MKFFKYLCSLLCKFCEGKNVISICRFRNVKNLGRFVQKSGWIYIRKADLLGNSSKLRREYILCTQWESKPGCHISLASRLDRSHYWLSEKKLRKENTGVQEKKSDGYENDKDSSLFEHCLRSILTDYPMLAMTDLLCKFLRLLLRFSLFNFQFSWHNLWSYLHEVFMTATDGFWYERRIPIGTCHKIDFSVSVPSSSSYILPFFYFSSLFRPFSNGAS